jgi:hypothetical protein
MGEWIYSATIPDFDTRWRWVVSVTPRPVYSRGNRPQCSLVRRLGGPLSRSGLYGEEKNSSPATNRTPVVQPIARCYTYWGIPTSIIIIQLVNKFPAFYGTRIFLTVVTRALSPLIHIPSKRTTFPAFVTYVFKIHFNIILPSMCRFRKLSLSFSIFFVLKSCMHFSSLCMCYMLRLCKKLKLKKSGMLFRGGPSRVQDFLSLLS